MAEEQKTKQPSETETRKKADENVVFIGSKPFKAC